MGRTIKVMLVGALLLTVSAGVALAVSGSYTGTNKSQTINGSNGDDRIAGGGGNDIINARDGDDELYGDFGGDTLNGEEGDDLLDGGSGADDLFGNMDDDFLNAADGENNDTVNGGPGTDTCVFDIGETANVSNCENSFPVG